jgi:hypothetical protein
MALTKNVRAFINHVKGHCKEVGIKCDIRPVKYLVLSGNIRCSGYFCEETMRLVVAGKNKDWLGILAHEYAHLTQWQDKSTNIWQTGSTGVTHLDDWLGGKKIRSIKKAIEWSRDLELDNEKRTVKLIKKWKLPIDLNDYIKKANAYIQFYNWMRYSKKWSSPGNAPYSNKTICEAMPANFKMNYKKMSDKYMKLYKEQNI